MTTPSRPLPDLTEPDTAPFWCATKQHELRYQVCRACSATVFPPRSHCPSCSALDLEWRTSVGVGIVHACTTTYQHAHPYFRSRVPYTIGLVDMVEGFRLLAELADATVIVGTRVRVGWEDHEDVCIPVFAIESANPKAVK